jgi:chemotaxis protein MotB
MKRKKRESRVSHERWLVSYADFITLLFAFFVVLFATGQSDRRKKVELAASIQSAFNQMGIFEPHPEVPTVSRLIGTGVSAAPPVAGPTFSPTQGAMLLVKRHIEQTVRPEINLGVVGVHESEEGLVISLEEAGFFDSGAADIRPSALSVLDRIASVLPECSLRVEGHTDNVPIHTPQFASNWELSSSRASSIARLLLMHANVHAENMSVAGYAEFHPAASNDTAEGRARNRRVDIVLLADGR